MSINNIDIATIFSKLTPAKQRRYLGWRIAYLVTIGATIAGCILLALFVYQNIFTTLNNANNIILLSSEMGMDSVDMTALDKAENYIKNRQNQENFSKDLRNIFEYHIVSASNTPASVIIKN